MDLGERRLLREEGRGVPVDAEAEEDKIESSVFSKLPSKQRLVGVGGLDRPVFALDPVDLRRGNGNAVEKVAAGRPGVARRILDWNTPFV